MGMAERCRFQVATASADPGRGYDLVTVFDALHDMGDPVGRLPTSAKPSLLRDLPAGRAVCRRSAGGQPDPGRAGFRCRSTLLCVPHALSEKPGLALGAQAGEQRLREVATAAGFGRFRRVAQTPFNLVYEGRPSSP
jgi:hypothetical protein